MKHLALAVSDQQRSRRFYETYFGFDAQPAQRYDDGVRKITCPDGTMRIGYTPEVGADPAPPGETPQKGVWTIVSGTGEYEGLRGDGKSEAVYGPSPSSPVRSTFTGTVTR